MSALCRPDGSGGHAEPVWALKYVSSGTNEGDEMLVSTSTDGRVLAWKHTQSLEPSELMRLKRAVAQRRLAGALPAAEQAKKVHCHSIRTCTTRYMHQPCLTPGTVYHVLSCSHKLLWLMGRKSRARHSL